VSAAVRPHATALRTIAILDVLADNGGLLVKATPVVE
jgi:hypothetical protein